MTTETDLAQMDRRVAARLIRKGALSEKDVEKALKTLPNLADQVLPIETTFEESAAEGLEPDAR